VRPRIERLELASSSLLLHLSRMAAAIESRSSAFALPGDEVMRHRQLFTSGETIGSGCFIELITSPQQPTSHCPRLVRHCVSHHSHHLGQSKAPEEREFYVRLAIRERWSKEELDGQFKAALSSAPCLVLQSLPLVRQTILSINISGCLHIEFLVFRRTRRPTASRLC